MDDICVCFLLYSRLRLSFVSVVFDLSASLNDVASAFPILLPVDTQHKFMRRPLFCIGV